MTTNDDLWHDITDWITELHGFAEELCSSPPVFEKQQMNDMINKSVKLLVALNRLIEKAEDEAKDVFYTVSGTRVDSVFAKLRGLSTHCEKEIEEFEDEREDWCS